MTQKARVEEFRYELRFPSPKDPNDDKNVIVEIRAGAPAGMRRPLFAAEIHREGLTMQRASDGK